jgi:hypothetical protein
MQWEWEMVRWHELLVNNMRWELVLNHYRAPMLLAPGPHRLAPRLASA